MHFDDPSSFERFSRHRDGITFITFDSFKITQIYIFAGELNKANRNTIAVDFQREMDSIKQHVET